MAVVSVKVSKELKSRMEEYRELVDWPSEIREFIKKRIRELERQRAVEEAAKILEKVKPSPPGTAAKLVRMDREGY